jgi:hypothetical protein
MACFRVNFTLTSYRLFSISHLNHANPVL